MDIQDIFETITDKELRFLGMEILNYKTSKTLEKDSSITHFMKVLNINEEKQAIEFLTEEIIKRYSSNF